MRATGKYLFLLGLIASSSVAARGADPFYSDEMYRAPSLNGLTGLVNMNLPFTMGPGISVVGGVAAGSLTGVYDSFTEATAAIRIGLSENVEIGVKGKSYRVDPVGSTVQAGLGDTEAMIKWKFRDQNENLPAMALELGAILPTGDENKGFAETDSFGIKFGLTAGVELAVFDDGYLGLYGEAQAVAIDQLKSTSPYKEMYGVISAGLAFPLNADNRLSFFTEYTNIVNREAAAGMGNYTIVSPGLRYAHPNFSLTVAAQVVDYEALNKSQTRLLGQLSLGF